MTNALEMGSDERAAYRVRGEISRRLSWFPIRVFAVLSGLVFVRGLLVIAARYLLRLRRSGILTLSANIMILEMAWSFLGKRVKESKIQIALESLPIVRLENKMGYIHLVVGAGALAVGTWIGLQFLVDGLNAGYPYLALVGAGVVASGVIVDLLLYVYVPSGRGRSRLTVVLGPWKMRVTGVDPQEAESLLRALREYRDRPARAE